MTYTDLHDPMRDIVGSLLRQAQERPGSVDGADPLRGSTWYGLEVPEYLGGAGAAFAETLVLAEVIGRFASHSSVLGTAVLGVGALNLLEDVDLGRELLRSVASGHMRLAVAFADSQGEGPLGRLPFLVEFLDGVYRVTGAAAFVPDATSAERILLIGSDGSPRPIMIAVNRYQPGLVVTPQQTLDETHDLCVVSAEGVTIEPSALWRISVRTDELVGVLWRRAMLALAADSFGLMQTMLDRTVEYSKQRFQFGRAIGTFQAVKHACADMYVRQELAHCLLQAAYGSGGASTQIRVTPSMTKSYICDAAMENVGKALQLHGGIGYTWESGIHVYLKRAALNRLLFGSPLLHRQRVAAALSAGLDASTEFQSDSARSVGR